MNARQSVLLLILVITPGVSVGTDQGPAEVDMSTISGDTQRPRRHFRLRNPAHLSVSEAERTYHIAKRSMAIGYATSNKTQIEGYQTWTRYNTSAYLSSTHGNHYVNNYANAIANKYGRFEEAGTLPVGSVIAKDSFAVTQSGLIVLGPVFIMEKMSAGFNYVSGDWRYTMIRPDGRMLGTTGGHNSDRVQYCATCHLFRARQDHLYFIPEKFRVKSKN